MAPSRKYDIVVLGATGYTGSLTVKHIAAHLPDDLKWAIAGRSKAKLYDLAAEIRKLRPNGSQPEIEIVSLDHPEQVHAVVKNTKVVVSVVTYLKVGDIVIESAIEHGTDYVDTAGDTELTKSWIEKYHDKAEAAGVALIHACGMLTGPHDVLSLASARALKQASGSTTKELVLSIKEFAINISGGTWEAITTRTTEEKDPKLLQELSNPWVLSPVKGRDVYTESGRFGLRHNTSLGVLSQYAFTAPQDRAIVHRTWGLLRNTDSDFGPNFQYNEYQEVGSTVGGIIHLLFGIVLGTILGNPFALKLLSFIMPTPGSGPELTQAERSPIKLEALALPDDDNSPRVRSAFIYPSASYHTTALFLGQAAASLLYTRSLEGGVKGGCLTPAILGEDFVKRLVSGGATITVEVEK